MTSTSSGGMLFIGPFSYSTLLKLWRFPHLLPEGMWHPFPDLDQGQVAEVMHPQPPAKLETLPKSLTFIHSFPNDGEVIGKFCGGRENLI